jgi:hypothetical protein
MALTPDQKAEIDLYIAASLQKRRIPELTPFNTYGDLSLLDRMPLWMNSVNKTVWTDLLNLRALLTTGASGTIEPVLTGDTVIHEVTAAEAGGTDVLEPALAGKSFFLRLEGRPVKPSEFQILNAGGFRMTAPDYELQEGQLFDMEVYELQASGGGPAALSSSFIVGTVNVPVNTILNGVNDVNKIIKIRGGAAKIEITLPDLATTAENAFLVLEADLNNDYQNKIKTQAGQFIYMNGQGLTEIYIGLGEAIWLFKGPDGWYDLNQFGKNYLNIGKPFATYSIGDDELICKGQLLSRADYPRLWKYVQSLGAAAVADNLWNVAQIYRQGNAYTLVAPVSGTYETIPRPYRGAYSLGDGLTTFRLPDLQNMFLRGLKSDSGADTERYQNNPGNFQQNMIKAHDHEYDIAASETPNGLLVYTRAGAMSAQKGTVKPFGGVETRPDNIGLFWAVKY